MTYVYIILVALIVMCKSECLLGTKSVIESKWDKYLPEVFTQDGPLCWAYATASYVQTMANYEQNKLLKRKQFNYTIIPNELKNEMVKYFDNEINVCHRENPEKGWHPLCALIYLEHIDSQISVTNSHFICMNKNNYETLMCIKNHLYSSVVLAVMYFHEEIFSENPVRFSIVENKETNHVVLITDLCLSNDGTYYINYRNSHGKEWGINGNGYIRMNVGKRFTNNLGILEQIMVADISVN